MKINTSRKAGFTLVEIMIVVAIIGLLAAIAIPNFVRARKTAQMNSCVNNLRLIDSAVQQYLLEQGGTASVTALATVQPYLGRGEAGQLPTCPSGGTYTVDSTATPVAACSLGQNDGFPHVLP
ncbi:MAG: competence type IV pilus major pilin ComGC [Limisphaerales bacterium]